MISKVRILAVYSMLCIFITVTVSWFIPRVGCTQFLTCYTGRDYRIVILSTSEPTNADGSARDRTKSICNPFVFNTVISRARSLIVCVGNPYVLLRKEQHMVSQYGEKAKCWSNFLKLCIDNKTFHVGDFGASKEEVKWMCSPLPSIVDYFVGVQNPEDLPDMKG